MANVKKVKSKESLKDRLNYLYDRACNIDPYINVFESDKIQREITEIESKIIFKEN